MAPHDRDSSLDDAGDYAETNVLLGYASKELTEDAVSHLGGCPSWIDPNAPAPARLGRCNSCNGMMTLLLQLNGELPEVFPGHERRLYVFACRGEACRRKDGSVRALRGVRVTETIEGPKVEKKGEPKQKAPQQQNIGESLFGGAQNPFSSSSPANPFSSSASALPTNPFSATVSQAGFPPLSSLAAKPAQNPPSDPLQPEQPPATLPDTFSSKLKLNTPPAPPPQPEEPFPLTKSLSAPYPLYHLDADYETLSAEETPVPPTNLPTLGDTDDTPGSRNTKDEPYESPLDKPFQKFAARLAQNPLQVLRYEFKGQPLLYSKTDAVGRLLSSASSSLSASTTGIPRCGNCGVGRVFECQLTPQAIVELEVEEEGFEGMEWGTVIIGVCEKDCAPRWVKEGHVGYLEEWAGVQWEEVGKKG